MKKMLTKRIIALLMATLILLLACACNEAPPKETEPADATEDVTEKPTEKPTEPVEEPTEPEEDDNGGLEEAIPEEKYYKVVYSMSENGKIEGNQVQTVKRGEAAEPVTAVADAGYVFVKWSDGSVLATRNDSAVYEDLSVSPIFVSIDYEYTVTYQILRNGALHDEIVKTAKASEIIEFTPAAPQLAYIYGEWSDGIVTPDRVDGVSADGKTFVLDYDPLSLNSVPSIEIDTADGKGVTSKSEYKTCVVSLSNAPEDQCFEGASALIRGRGNSSWSYPKKGFKLKFDKKQSMLGSDYEVKNWVFISNYGDKSLIRNMIAYDMSEAFKGLEFTTMHRFIDVYLDGEYYGLFLLCDRIDENEGRLNIETPVSDNPEEMGYIIEIGMTDRLGAGKDGWNEDRDKNRSYSISYPDINDPNFKVDVHLKYIENYVDKCLAALSARDWELINELIDIDSFVDYYIIQEMFMNKDCFWRSIHFYKKPNGKLYAGPAWDFDQGIGNVNDLFGTGRQDTTFDCDIDFVDTQWNSGKTAGNLWIAQANTWYRRLFRNEEFVDLVAQRLAKYQPIIAEIVERTTTDGSVKDAYYTLYGDAMNRNFERWKIMGVQVWPNTPTLRNIKTVSGQIDYINDWFAKRYNLLCEWYQVDAGV